MRRAAPALTALALLLAACSGADSSDAAADLPQFDAPGSETAAGDHLPDHTLPVLGSEEEVSTHAFQGTPTVVNFWATWCPFCVDEMPDFERAHQALGDAVTFVGVDREDPREEQALALARETGVTYLLVADDDGSFFRAAQGRGMPTTLFVDADGVVQHRFSGPLTEEQLLGLVDEHLGVSAEG